jgi:hypothetical protein
MGKVVTACLVLVGLINLAPFIGVISTQKLESAYSVTLAGNDLAILMRHRALLFGILGSFIIYSAYAPLYQSAAMIMAGVSMIGFTFLVIDVGGYNQAVSKVLFFDILGIILLLLAVALKYLSKSN